jgi:arginine decarboxylase
MECIMAVANFEENQLATAGISFGWLYDKKTNKKYGGLVCEHQGNFSEETVRRKLNMSLQEIYYNGFAEKYELKEIKTIVESFRITKKFGTAIVALCFVDYIYPILEY